MSSESSVSVVIPVFEEEASLEPLIARCLAACRGMNRPFELLFVDDGSRDGSPEILRAAASEHPGEIVYVGLNRNYGQHAALLAGFEEARGDCIVTLDADLQNPPEEIPRLVEKLDEGFDVVGTIRKDREDSLFRRFSSRMINRMVRRVTGVQMHDYGCMLRGYSSGVIRAMLSCRERSTFIPVLANSFAARTTEIEVAHAARAAGESKYGFWKLVHLQYDLLTSMTTTPLRLLSIFGGLISALGIGFGIFLMVMRLAQGAAWAADGVFTLFAILFTFVGAQFIGLGLLGEYIGRIYHDVRARPRSFVQQVVRGDRDPDSAAATARPRLRPARLRISTTSERPSEDR